MLQGQNYPADTFKVYVLWQHGEYYADKKGQLRPAWDARSEAFHFNTKEEAEAVAAGVRVEHLGDWIGVRVVML